MHHKYGITFWIIQVIRQLSCNLSHNFLNILLFNILNFARKLLSPQGFLYTFLEIRMLYQTYEDAYEMLESQVERITGERMYSEYSSFRIQYLRWKTKKTLNEVSG